MEPETDLAADLRRLALRVIWGAFLFEALLVALHLWVSTAPPGRFSQEFLDFGSLKFETGLGTWFSSLQFAALAAVLAALSARAGRSRPWGREALLWGLFAAGALFLSADEAAGIHEQVGSAFGEWAAQAPAGTLLFWLGRNYGSYYWALVYVPLAVPAALVVISFLWRELGPHRHLPWIGVGLFFLGAVGLDALEGWVGDPKHGPVPLGTTGLRIDLILVEEGMEMVAVTLVLAACLLHAASVFGGERQDPALPPDGVGGSGEREFDQGC